MFTKNIGMKVCLTDAEFICNLCAQACCIKKCTCSDNVVCRNVRRLYKLICKDINRVCYKNINCIWCSFCNLRNNWLENVYVNLCKVKAWLSRLASNTRSNDYNVRILCIFVSSGVDINRSHVRCSLTNIHSFAFCTLFINVNKNDFCCNTLKTKSISYRRANLSGTNNSNFVCHSNLLQI